MSERNQIIEKINKLLALSQSPNENEAKLAAQSASDLIHKFNIGVSELKRGTVIEFDLESGKTKIQYWQRILIGSIAESNFCEVLMQRSSKGVIFKIIGRELNISATNLMYQYLSKVAHLLSPKDRSEKTPYLEGFAIGIQHRLDEKRENWGTDEMKALVRVKTEDEIAVKNHIETEYPNLKSAANKEINMSQEAFQKGYDQSQSINLSKQVEPAKLRIKG
ncbi:PF10979 family protein [Leptospira weilii serovar Topaz str. LT2116]|uniref:PF10979 family protein n=1 Tax=Leptospira weilii serovar Topaz str. LT2116 TaxID=1088540 RepID=M3G863_9LEPT|nr:PF10979 family protein [Leptospira weilii serovar Topaz str. LT2116]